MLERAASLLTPGDDCDCGCGTLTYRRPEPGPITVMTQRLEPFVAAALDAVPAEHLPDCRSDGTVAAVGRDIEAQIGLCGLGPSWLAEWLAANVAFQVRLFAELTGTSAVRVRLETVADDGCERFHTDAVRQRLLCTYRGPGTEYLDPKVVALAGRGDLAGRADVPPTAIRRLERGAIAMVRGSRDARPDRPGLVHRSPRIEGTGVVRLLLVVDEAG